MRRELLLLFCCFCIFTSSIAQNNNKQYFSHDVGVLIGAAYYIGDLNSKNFYMSQPAVGAFYRFNYNYRVAFTGGFSYGNIQGDDSQSNDPYQIERNLNFKTSIMEFYTRAEFNFWEYKTGDKNFIFAPYVFLGIGVFHFNPQAHYGNSWIDLRGLSTEGQGTPLNHSQKPYALTQPCIPFGVGFKLSLSQQIGLGFEWGPRKTFTDYLDDVSGAYVDPNKLAQYKGGMAAILSNRSKNVGANADDIGKLRGNPSTKDWYFYYGLVISFKLKGKPKECRSAF
ncbi:MAG: type IX secretion system protein PorG [Bacteroidia bacterium]